MFYFRLLLLAWQYLKYVQQVLWPRKYEGGLWNLDDTYSCSCQYSIKLSYKSVFQSSYAMFTFVRVLTWTITSFHALRWLVARRNWVATVCNCQKPATIASFPVARRCSLLQTHSQRAMQLNWTELANSIQFSSVQLRRPLWRGLYITLTHF